MVTQSLTRRNNNFSLTSFCHFQLLSIDFWWCLFLGFLFCSTDPPLPSLRAAGHFTRGDPHYLTQQMYTFTPVGIGVRKVNLLKDANVQIWSQGKEWGPPGLCHFYEARSDSSFHPACAGYLPFAHQLHLQPSLPCFVPQKTGLYGLSQWPPLPFGFCLGLANGEHQ